MAHIRQYRGKWRVEVQKHGQRLSKLVDTEDEAVIWGRFTEAQLGAQTKRYRPRDALKANGPELVTMAPRCVLDACREIPHPQIDILEAAIPTDRASGVYFLICAGEVIYVGQSVDVLHRIARHRREGKSFDAFSYLECEVSELDRLESLYIKAFVPSENLTLGNHRPGQEPRRGTGRRAPRPAAKGDSEASKSGPLPGSPEA